MPPPGGAIRGFDAYSAVCSKYGEYRLILYAASVWTICFSNSNVAPGRLSLNVVSSWWKDEAAQYGAPFDVHDARYARTQEWLDVLGRLLREDTVTHEGPLYHLAGTVLEPKPARLPAVYMGGESPKAKEVIAQQADAHVMHGDSPEVIAAKVADLTARRAAAGRPPLAFGVSGYVICRDTQAEAQAEPGRGSEERRGGEAYASYQQIGGRSV